MSSPIKPTLKTELSSIVLIILCVVAGFYFYANFPDKIASHWNFQGQADGYTGRAFGAFFFPGLIAAIYLMFLFIPYFDPKRDRYQEFSSAYHSIKTVLVAFMALIYLATGLFNLGYNINIGIVTAAAVGVLFIIMGQYLSQLKHNWFIGIRTPWTLSSETVWDKTHKVGGWLFTIMGVVMIIIPFLPETIGLIVFIAGLAAVVLGSFGYSYWLFLQERRLKK